MRTPLLLIALIALIGLATLRYTSAEISALPTSPLAAATRIAPTALSGRAGEVIKAGSYTYIALEVEGAAAPTWVVVMGHSPARGQLLHLTAWATYDRFDSPRLDRTFAPLTLATMR